MTQLGLFGVPVPADFAALVKAWKEAHPLTAAGVGFCPIGCEVCKVHAPAIRDARDRYQKSIKDQRRALRR